MSIKVLTFNVCWGCMKLDERDRTVIDVVNMCKNLSDTSCIANISNIISENKPCDFIALQEAAKWRDIKNCLVMKWV